jgi:hypothetical protein
MKRKAQKNQDVDSIASPGICIHIIVILFIYLIPLLYSRGEEKKNYTPRDKFLRVLQQIARKPWAKY